MDTYSGGIVKGIRDDDRRWQSKPYDCRQGDIVPVEYLPGTVSYRGQVEVGQFGPMAREMRRRRYTRQTRPAWPERSHDRIVCLGVDTTRLTLARVI